MPFQYGNAANPLAHYEGTAAEILADLPTITHFVAGMGTGGTLTGNGRRLHEHDPNIQVIAAEPELGDLVYGLRSLDDGFVPPIFDPSEVNRKFLVNSADALRTNRDLTAREGIFAGISSGAVVHVAQRIAVGDRRGRHRLPAARRRLEVPVHRGLGRGHRDGREGRRGVAVVVGPCVSDPRPIGVFDSGVGGLTVARAILDLLPHEPLIYVGDSARFPYGPKPVEEIRRYAIDIADYLVHRDVKMLVVACNSVEVSGLGDIAARAGIPVVGVIDPGTRTAVHATRNGVIGLIGTEATVTSGAYDRAVAATGASVTLHSQACPVFVEHVERGDTTSDALRTRRAGVSCAVDREGHRHVDPGVHALPAALGPAPAGARPRRRAGVLGRGDREGRVRDAAAIGARARRARPLPVHEFLSTGDPELFQRLAEVFLGPELLEVRAAQAQPVGGGSWN